MLERGRNIVEVVEKTSYRLRLSQEKHCQYNDQFMHEDSDFLSTRSASGFFYIASPSHLYPSDVPHYSSSSMMVVQVMVIEIFTIEEQLVNLT